MAGSSRREGASQSRSSVADRLRSWLQHHQQSAGDSLRRLFLHWLASVMTWLVIGIALSLPLGFAVALDNLRSVSGSWDNTAQLSLFLHNAVSEEEARQLAQRLRARPEIAATQLLTRTDALREFRQLSGFGDVLQLLDDNPLPNLILVKPRQEQQQAGRIEQLQAELSRMPGVERAVLDKEWVQRLNALMQLGQRAVLVLGTVLALGVLLIIGNTIRLAIENRRAEIVIVKLVGGSDAFVRRPFLYTGLWYGCGGAVLCWLIISLAWWGLRPPLAALALLYQGDFSPHGLSVGGGLQVLLLGGLLGLSGAWLAVTRHLRGIEPG